MIDQVHEINGSEYRFVINKSGPTISPLFVYIHKLEQPQTFGGYVYSIKRKNTDDISQLMIKRGDCEEQAKSLSYLMCKKYEFPNYVNINGVDTFDFNFVLKKVDQLVVI